MTSRLRALGVPFEDVDIDADPAAARRVASLNHGNRVTPTVIVGDDAAVQSEPTLEALGRMLAVARYDVGPPQATDYHGELTTRSIPIRHLDAIGEGQFSLDRLRGRQQVALFLGHGADCLACFGYARQLARRREALAEANGLPFIVVAGDTIAAAGWRHGIDDAVTILADPDGGWKGAVATHVGATAGDGTLTRAATKSSTRSAPGVPRVGGWRSATTSRTAREPVALR